MRRIAPLFVIALSLLVVTPVDADRNRAKQGGDVVAERTIELVEPGTGPRRPLRHRFEAGITQRVRLRIQSTMRIQAGERNQEVPVPIMRLDLTLGPTAVSGGRLRYPFRVTGIDAAGEHEEAMLEQVRQQLQGLVGSHGNAEIDDQGRVVAFDYDLSPDASAQLRQQSQMLRDSLSQLLPHFPDEPVGVGAEWRVRDQLRLPQKIGRAHV